MTTRLANGLPGIICTTCNGCGQERYKASTLPPQFNAGNGRYEGEMFIRKCIKCDGLGAIEDANKMRGVPHHVELRGMQAATPLESLAGGIFSRLGW
jgi:DnaJ-class molecular chaperone